MKKEDCGIAEVGDTIRCFCPDMCDGVVIPPTTTSSITTTPVTRVTKIPEIVIPNGGIY